MALTFQAGSRLDYYEVIEFLLHRYGSLEEFKKMSVLEFFNFWKVAQEQKVREQNYLAWVQIYPHMDKKTFISFDDFHNKATGKNLDNRPASEIMNEVDEIRRKMKEREDGNINI